jgi:hypothetical protein
MLPMNIKLDVFCTGHMNNPQRLTIAININIPPAVPSHRQNTTLHDPPPKAPPPIHPISRRFHRNTTTP